MVVLAVEDEGVEYGEEGRAPHVHQVDLGELQAGGDLEAKLVEAVQEGEEHRAAVEAGVAGQGEAAREGESQGHPVARDQTLQTGASPKLFLQEDLGD